MTPLQKLHYSIIAGNLLDYAVNGVAGRGELDPVYVAITEKRDGPTAKLMAKYSSCADLAHWLWWRLGLRSAFLNREERTDAAGDFKYGVNLNRWWPPPVGKCPYAVKPGIGANFAAGDIVVIDNAWGGHVMCVTGWDAASMRLFTAEYGQPGGKARQHVLGSDGRKGLQLAPGKPIMSHAVLSMALEAEKDDLVSPDIECLRGWTADEAIDAMLKGTAGE